MLSQFPDGFDPQPTLMSDDFLLRPLSEKDRGPLFIAAGDPNVWAGHPAKDRHKREVFDPYFDTLLGMGGCLIFTDHQTKEVIGCSAFYTDPNAPSRVSIGFTFLVCKHWGGATNRAVKRLMLGHVYSHSTEAWFHIAPSNLRSQAATKKLGAVLCHESPRDLGGGAQTWQCYCLTREAWEASNSARS